MTVNLDMSSGLDFNHEREVEQLRIAIEFHEQQIGRLESRIRGLQEEKEEIGFREFFKLTEKEVEALADADEKFGLPDDLFEPEEEFPPQSHLDNLERQLDYNLGQVDGFCDLDWQSKCDLACVAVDNDLTVSECETILDLSQGGEARDDGC
jgi:hypothetical protein